MRIAKQSVTLLLIFDWLGELALSIIANVFFRSNLVFLWLSASALPALSQDKTTYRLDPKEVACLQSNRMVYEQIEMFPAIVPLVGCPDLPENPISALVINEGPNIKVDKGLKFDNFVYLIKSEELSCLLDADITDSRNVVLFSPRECVTQVHKD